MSEKRFKLSKYVTPSSVFKFFMVNERGFNIFDNNKKLSPNEIVDKLNGQQATISALKEENEVLLEEWSERQQYFKKVEDEYHERVMEQQATIDKQELRLQQLEELLELSENLNKSYREKLIDINLKMVIDDE